MLKNKTFTKLFAIFALVIALAAGTCAALQADSVWTPDYGWYSGKNAAAGTAADPYILASAEDIAGLAELVNNGSDDFKDKHVRLALDVDLAKKEWQPIGWMVAYGNLCGFAGTFDGGGHRITGLQISNGENLPKGSRGKIDKNGTISNTTGLFGYLTPDGTVKNIYLEGSVTNKVSQGAAGLVGWADGVIKNCAVSCDVDASGVGRAYAGVVTSLQGNVKGFITNCISYGTVKSTVGAAYSGGIAGYGYWYRGNLLNCVAMCSSVTSTMDAGGIYGGFNVSVTADSVSVCDAVKGSQTQYTGGIVGAFGLGIQNCYWLKVKESQPGGAVGGSGTDGLVTDASKLPVAAAIIDTADLGTMKPGDERTIHIHTYPPTADNSHVKYKWSVDSTNLDIISGQGTPELKVRAKTPVKDIAFAVISADVSGMLGHTVSSDKTIISNFDTVVTPEASVKISKSTIHVESLSVGGLTTAMTEGESRIFTAAVKPSDAEDQSVTWAITKAEGSGAAASDLLLTNRTDGSVAVLLRKGHETQAFYTLTATATDGGVTASAIITTAAVKGEEISGVIPVGDAVPVGADAVKPAGANASDLVRIASAISADVSAFRTNSKGLVFLDDAIAGKAAASAAESEKLTVSKVIHLPLYTAGTKTANNLAAVALVVSGDSLLADAPEKVRVVKARPDGTGTFFEYAASSADYTDGHFTIQNMDDSVMAHDGAISAGESYKLVLYIKDNGGFDLDPAECSIVDPLAIVQATAQPQPSSGSSSGCSAGFGALALLALVPLFRRKKR